MLPFVLALATCVQMRPCWAQVIDDCSEEELDPNIGSAAEITDGEKVYRQIYANQTHRWFYRNFNITLMNLPDIERKLIIHLEPCYGVVYLLVRKTRPCYPDPYSCIDVTPGAPRRNASECTRTHYISEINGSRDGGPTFYELPLTSTTYFISIFATEDADYNLLMLSDIGAFPRPGGNGRIVGRQLSSSQAQVTWSIARYFPVGITSTVEYYLYVSLLIENDENRTNKHVFLRPGKIMNTVCGIENNTDRVFDTLPVSLCDATSCNVTIDGLISGKRYVVNVVAKSHRGYRVAYAGHIHSTSWIDVDQAMSDNNMQVVGAVSGSAFGLLGLMFMVMLTLNRDSMKY